MESSTVFSVACSRFTSVTGSATRPHFSSLATTALAPGEVSSGRCEAMNYLITLSTFNSQKSKFKQANKSMTVKCPSPCTLWLYTGRFTSAPNVHWLSTENIYSLLSIGKSEMQQMMCVKFCPTQTAFQIQITLKKCNWNTKYKICFES